MIETCLFCGGDRSEPDHVAKCDGRQGAIEAQDSILDPVLSHAVTEAAIAQSTANAEPDDLDVLTDAVHAVSRTHQYLTTDDVWDELHRSGRTLSAEGKRRSVIGPAMRRSAALGYTRRTADTKFSIRPARHRNPLRVHESLIYAGKTER